MIGWGQSRLTTKQAKPTTGWFGQDLAVDAFRPRLGKTKIHVSVRSLGLPPTII